MKGCLSCRVEHQALHRLWLPNVVKIYPVVACDAAIVSASVSGVC
jgi:hypothetical protein